MRRKELPLQCAGIVPVTLEETVPHQGLPENNHSNLHYEQIWEIIPSATPKIIRKCTRCSSDRFICSNKFRVNANKKVIDVWLIYKCQGCEDTFKVPIITRTVVSKINQEVLRKFEGNDKRFAWYYAFNACQQQKDLLMDWDMDFSVRVGMYSEKISEKNLEEKRNISITSEFFLRINLFSVLRQQMGLSRNQIEKLHANGKIEIYTLQDKAIKLKSWVGTGCFLKVSRELMIAPSLSLISQNV